MSDRIFGAVGLVLAVFYLWAASTIVDSFMVDVIGPRTFPYMIGAALAISSLVFLLRPDEEPEWPAFRDFAEVAYAAAVLFLYAWTLSEIGFIIATTLAAAYLTWRLGTEPLNALIVGFALAVGIYAVFHLILGLSLAEGPFGF